MYINGEGGDWPNCAWRSLEDLNDDGGKPVRNRLKFENGYGAVDIAQGKVGDCWFLSALSAVSQNRPDLIKRLVHHKTSEINKQNAYIFRFFKARN